MERCEKCGSDLEAGFIFSTKDGALSFADEVPSAFENARHAPGFIELAPPRVGGRTAVAATVCRTCRRVAIEY